MGGGLVCGSWWHGRWRKGHELGDVGTSGSWKEPGHRPVQTFPAPTYNHVQRLAFSITVFFLKAAPVAYGSSQAQGQIRATAAGLHHSHSNIGSEPHLQPTPTLKLKATPNP